MHEGLRFSTFKMPSEKKLPHGLENQIVMTEGPYLNCVGL